MDEKKKQAQDERSCDHEGHECCKTCLYGTTPVCIHDDVCDGKSHYKAQEQGGDDKPIQGCYYDHDDCEAVRDLRARLAACEKERDHYKDFCGSQRFASDYQNADQMREDINDLRRQLAYTKASEAKMIDALATGKQIGLVTEEYAEVKRGKWLMVFPDGTGKGVMIYKTPHCSVCESGNDKIEKYCPSCGAKMEETL